MKKAYITRRLPPVAKELLSRFFSVDENSRNEPLPKEKLLEAVTAYDGILATVPDLFTKDVLARAHRAGRLKVISNYAIGLDNIDVGFAKENGIAVYNVPDVVTNSTADHAFALLLALIRKIPEAREFVRDGRWKAWDPELFIGDELNGKTFGIIGYGRIGRAVAKRAVGFGLRVIFYNRSAVEIEPQLMDKVKQVSLDELFMQSDYISLHISLTNDTKNFIDIKAMEKMQKRPVLLNLARGGVVNTDDLVAALKNGLIRSAALDVTAPEPIGSSHPLCQLENCLVVPHIGTATKECREQMARCAAENIINHLGKGESNHSGREKGI